MNKLALLKCILFTPSEGGWGLPIALNGGVGISKTSLVEQVAQSYGMHCETLSPGLRGEAVFGTIPVPVNGVITYPPHGWALPFLEPGARGIVFVDELTSVDRHLQPVLMGLIRERRVGSSIMAPGVRCIAAYNPSGTAANGSDIPKPIANRLGHLTWPAPTIEDRAAYRMGQGATVTPKSPKTEEDRVMARWSDEFAISVGLELAFLRGVGASFKNTEPADSDPRASGPWPSDRTWSYCTDALTGARIHGLSDEDRDLLGAAFIGNAAYDTFAGFCESADLPNPAEILDGTVKFKWDPKRLDRSAAVIGACTALVAPKDAQKRDARAAVLWELLGDSTSYDITVPSAKVLADAKLMSKAAFKTLEKLGPALKAANVDIGTEF